MLVYAVARAALARPARRRRTPRSTTATPVFGRPAQVTVHRRPRRGDDHDHNNDCAYHSGAAALAGCAGALGAPAEGASWCAGDRGKSGALVVVFPRVVRVP
ncbi:hypothetical protein [Kineococcus auxinigenes]|uniref:hypothetical protein n=1 Tax=Kineococcus sp. SYSU DK023 TaxID=3383144 RepID=UPI003D7C455F